MTIESVLPEQVRGKDSKGEINVIVGAGEAGLAAARAMREAGFDGKIALLEEEAALPYARPPLSKDVLTGAIGGATPIRSIGWYSEQRIDLHRGARVIDVDSTSCRLWIDDVHGPKTLPYDRLVIATGARARSLPEAMGAGVNYLRTYGDALSLRDRLLKGRSIAVIGGGIIGLEAASSALQLGCSVVVIERSERLMKRCATPDASKYLHGLHLAAGVEVLLSTRVLSLEWSGREYAIGLESGVTVRADVVLAGIGVVPNDKLARAAGCAVEDGVTVDVMGRTSVPGIFAAGDVASLWHPLFERRLRVEAWQHARKHGAHVGRTACGAVDSYVEVPWFWTDQHGANIQVVGAADQADFTHWFQKGAQRFGYHFTGKRLVAATAVNCGRDIRPASKLIAAGWTGDPSALPKPSIAAFSSESRVAVQNGEAIVD